MVSARVVTTSVLEILTICLTAVNGLKVFQNASSLGHYQLFTHRTGEFGPAANTYNVSGAMRLFSPSTGCNISSLYNQSTHEYEQLFAGDIALILRGDCAFMQKAHNAQLLGAIGVVIGDNTDDDEYVIMAKTDVSYTVDIPSVFVVHDTYNDIYHKLTPSNQRVYSMLDADGEYTTPRIPLWKDGFFYLCQIGGFLVQFFFAAFIVYVFEKFWKPLRLKKFGKTTIGLVSKKYFRQHKRNVAIYCIEYTFNGNKQKSVDLVLGYVRQNEREQGLFVPLALIRLTLSYFGRNMITDYNYNTATATIQQAQWRPLKVGDAIEIVYDPKHPNLVNQPLMEFASQEPNATLLELMLRPDCSQCECGRVIAYIWAYVACFFLMMLCVAVYPMSMFLLYWSFETIDSVSLKFVCAAGCFLLQSLLVFLLFWKCKHIKFHKRPSQYTDERLIEKNYSLLENA